MTFKLYSIYSNTAEFDTIVFQVVRILNTTVEYRVLCSTDSGEPVGSFSRFEVGSGFAANCIQLAELPGLITPTEFADLYPEYLI